MKGYVGVVFFPKKGRQAFSSLSNTFKERTASEEMEEMMCEFLKRLHLCVLYEMAPKKESAFLIDNTFLFCLSKKGKGWIVGYPFFWV